MMGPDHPVVYYTKLFLIIIGGGGNIGIWMTSEFRKMSRSVICITLAFANTTYLSLQISLSTTLYFYGEDLIFAVNDTLCRLFDVLLNTSLHLDSFLILYLSVERCAAVFSPHLVKRLFDQTTAAYYIVIITVIFLVFNLSGSILASSLTQLPQGRQYCSVDMSLITIIRRLFIAIIPLIVIIPTNIVIIVKVISQHRDMRQCIAVTQQQLTKKKSIKVTILTLSITFSYIVLNIPGNVFFLCCRENSKLISPLILLPMLNASVNFYAYTLASAEFRKKVKLLLSKANHYVSNLLTCCCPQNSVLPMQ